MKTRSKQRILYDEVMESEVKEQLNETREIGIRDASEMASRTSANLQSIIGFVDAKINGIVSYVINHLRNKSEEIKLDIEKRSLEKLRHETETKNAQLEKRARGLRLDLDQIKIDYNWKILKWWYVGILILATGDSILNYRAFLVFVPNLIWAIIFTFIVVFLLGFSAHISGRQIAEAKSIGKKWLIFITACLGAGLFFLILALIRARFSESIGEVSVITSTWFVIAINLFFFLNALAISVLYLPTKAQRANKTEQDQLKEKYLEVKQEQAQLALALQKEEVVFKELVETVCEWQVYQNNQTSFIERSRELIHAEIIKVFYMKGGIADSQTHIN